MSSSVKAPTATEPVRIIENFLDPESCKYVIDTYQDMCKRSTVRIDKADVVDTARTSSTFFLPDTDETIANIKAKVAKIVGIPVENIEGLQLVRYAKGEEYKFHYDYYDEIAGNQRVHTLLAYLNDVPMESGGATIFKNYNVKVYPKQGRVIWFRNMMEDGTMNANSLHAGEPIQGDVVKYAINIWTRQRRWIVGEETMAPTPPPPPPSMLSSLLGPTSWLHSWVALLVGSLLLIFAVLIAVFKNSKAVQRFAQPLTQKVRAFFAPLVSTLHL